MFKSSFLLLLGIIFCRITLFSQIKKNNCDDIIALFYKKDSFEISPPIKITSKKVIVKNKFRNRKFKIKINSCYGDSEVEIYNYSNILLSKGRYKKKHIESMDSQVFIDTEGKIMGVVGIFNLPCKDGVWNYFDDKGKITKKEIWKCDSLIQVENIK